MDVTVQEPGARVGRAVGNVPIVVLAVAAVREVAGEDPRTTDGEIDRALPDLVESCGEATVGRGLGARLVSEPATVVVPGEQHLPAVEHTSDRKGLVGAAHREVAENDHLVRRRHRGVPAFDERGVHLLRVKEGSAAVVDDVAMAEVEIGCEVASHDHRIAPTAPAQGSRLNVLT